MSAQIPGILSQNRLAAPMEGKKGVVVGRAVLAFVACVSTFLEYLASHSSSGVALWF